MLIYMSNNSLVFFQISPLSIVFIIISFSVYTFLTFSLFFLILPSLSIILSRRLFLSFPLRHRPVDILLACCQ